MAIFKAPYFADAILGFVYHARPGIRTMLVTNRLVLGYDPEWAERGTVANLAADIIHEVHHFVRRHFERSELAADRRLFNIAGDLAINPDLKHGGWDMHESAIYPENFKLPEGKTMEEYYDLLLQQKAKQPQLKIKIKVKGGGGKKEDSQPDPSPGDKSDGEKDDKAEGEGEGEEVGGVCAGHCGGIGGYSDTIEIEVELNATPNLGRSPAEVKSIEKRVIAAITQHAEQNGRGSIPHNLQELIKAFEEESHVRWQDELASVLRDATGRMQSGGDDFSLARPAKRSIMRGMIRPSMVEYLPEIAFIRDSSGSMGAPQLTSACREAYSIMQALGIDDVWFADADTQIAMPWKRVGPAFFRSLTDAYGRGGTSFIEPLQSAQRLQPSPDLLVYFTDGDGTAPDHPPPGMGVVWAVVPGHYNKAPAKWGKTVLITDDPKKRNAGVQEDV